MAYIGSVTKSTRSIDNEVILMSIKPVSFIFDFKSRSGKTVLTSVQNGHSQKDRKFGFQDQLSLNAGQQYCRMLQVVIRQYFRPSFGYHLSLRSFLLFLSGRFTQVLLYLIGEQISY